MKPYALITGASSGIGKAFAHVFARHGYNMVLVARSEDKLQALAKELRPRGADVIVLPKDLTRAGSPAEIFAELQEKFIEIEVLINNAGFGDFGFFHETSWAKESAMIDLNIKALTQMTKLFGAEMVRQERGYILNVASTAAFFPGPMMSVYYATKNYVLSFSEGIAEEWKKFGVSVTALCPGPTESGFQEASAMEDSSLVKGKKLPSPKAVAEFGYQALMNRRTVAVHGFVNRMMASLPRLLPKILIRKMVRKAQERV